jgi:hypothetical protein
VSDCQRCILLDAIILDEARDWAELDDAFEEAGYEMVGDDGHKPHVVALRELIAERDDLRDENIRLRSRLSMRDSVDRANAALVEKMKARLKSKNGKALAEAG